MAKEVETVTVLVSRPYVVIAGVNGGLRPVGRRRDYRASYRGHDIHLTTKDEMASRLRIIAYEAGVRVKIEYEQLLCANRFGSYDSFRPMANSSYRCFSSVRDKWHQLVQMHIADGSPTMAITWSKSILINYAGNTC